VNNSPNKLNTLDKNKSLEGLFTALRSVIHTLRLRSGLGPLTSRSVVSLLFLLYLLIGPVQGSTDIVSASLTYAFLIVFVIATTTVVAHGIALKRSLTISVLPPEQPATSGETVRIFLAVERARILPFTFLDISLDFEHQGASPAIVRASGFSQGERRIHIDTSFPHRGSWDIRGIKCSLKDVAGLTNFTWNVPQQTAVTIAPPTAHDSSLPVLSSTQRPGEMMIDIFNRQGEPFDIKSYHPSDGVKKIVWKAFAKRGELLSRHPEASMTPEGYVVILAIAGKEGDRACAQAIAYTESLARLNLEIIASCEGANGRPPAHEPETFKELLIDSVWDTTPHESAHLQRDAAALLDYCAQLTPGITVSKLLLFTSAERIASPEEAKELQDLAMWLSAQGIAPVFCLTAPSAFASTQAPSKLHQLSHLIVAPEERAGEELSASAYNAFLSSCLHRQWEVHV
jgi:hypothetical protein